MKHADTKYAVYVFSSMETEQKIIMLLLPSIYLLHNQTKLDQLFLKDI